MTRLRDFVRRYPIASIAVIVAVVVLLGLAAYRTMLGASAAAPPPQAATSPSPEATPAPATTPPAASAVTPPPAVSAVTPTKSAVTPTSPPGAGRPNPFQPLISPQAPSAPAGGGAPLPPVPPLAPGLPAAPASATPPVPAAPPAPEFTLVGFLWGDRALAVLQDSQGSYIVAPGDIVRPGVRVVAIDVRREVVELDQHGTKFSVGLQPPAATPGKP